MLRDAGDIARSTEPTEAYQNVMNLWRSSFASVRDSNAALAKSSQAMFRQWTQMMQGMSNPVNDGKTTKSASK